MIQYLQLHRPKCRPGSVAIRYREKENVFSKCKETFIPKGGIIEIFGVHGSGKSRMISKLYKEAGSLWKFEVIYIKATDSPSEILARNVGTKQIRVGEDEEDVPDDKVALLKQKARNAVLIIDDLDKLTGKKLEMVKDMLRVAKRVVYSAQSEQALNKTVRIILSRRKLKKATISLSSISSYDASNWLLFIVVVLLAVGGFPEISVVVLMARLALRGTQGVK